MKLDPKQIEKLIGALKQQAAEIAGDRANMVALVDAAKQKLQENKAALARVGQGLGDLLAMLKAYALDRYEGLSWKSVLLGVAAVIYFLNPFDLIPDFIVGGLVDDGFVVTWVLQTLHTELDLFRKWKQSQRKQKSASK